MGAAYLVWFAYPMPPLEQSGAGQLAPLPIRKTQDLVKRLEAAGQTDRAFMESARRTLKRLEQREAGLNREDFEALKRLETGALRRMSRRLQQLQQQRELLRTFDQELARLQGGADVSGKQARDLAGKLAELEAHLGSSGMNVRELRRLLKAAREAAGQGGKSGKKGVKKAGGKGGKGSGPRFSAGSLRALRRQVSALRKVNFEQLASAAQQDGQPGKGGVNRGPGVAPLRYSHETVKHGSARFASRGFSSDQGESTVLLAANLSKTAEESHADRQGVSKRRFEAGTDTRYWQKRLKPRHRSVLQRYFGDQALDTGKQR
jgi:hypothetical protein